MRNLPMGPPATKSLLRYTVNGMLGAKSQGDVPGGKGFPLDDVPETAIYHNSSATGAAAPECAGGRCKLGQRSQWNVMASHGRNKLFQLQGDMAARRGSCWHADCFICQRKIVHRLQ